MTEKEIKVNTLIIGAGRAGTTSLFALLEQHPQVCFSYLKEVHYFSVPDLYKRGEQYYHSFFRHYQNEAVLASADTYLFMDYEAIKRIHRYNPKMKILVVLRDPVERAYSSYWYSVNYGHHKAYPSFMDSAEREKGIEHEPDIVRRNNQGHFYGSLYYRHLNRWLEFFPREQFLLLTTSGLKEQPQDLTRELYRFLEIRDNPVEPGLENAAAVPRHRRMEKFLLDRNRPLRKALRWLVPRFLKDRLMRSGIVERLHRANRKTRSNPLLSGKEYQNALIYFRDDLQGLEKAFGIKFKREIETGGES